MKKDSGIYLNMLKKYAENLSHYWTGIIERDENLSLQITIYPLVADNFGAVEFNFINGKCENKAYEIKNKSHLIYSKYDIGYKGYIGEVKSKKGIDVYSIEYDNLSTSAQKLTTKLEDEYYDREDFEFDYHIKLDLMEDW